MENAAEIHYPTFESTESIHTHNLNDHLDSDGSATFTAHRLSPSQERKLVDYLEDHLLEITRNYKKRSHPSSTLPTLASYLTAVHPLLALVLQIPPAGPSASLRTSLLLRLTGEVLESIAGYRPDVDTLPQLLQWLDDLDKGWLTVLWGQAWDSVAHAGVDCRPGQCRRDAVRNQTDRTRLRSILIGGTNRMEEWLADIDATDQNFQAALETMGLQMGFNDLFARTLGEMGSLDGSMPVDPHRMAETC
ncbi:uncharacterized protein B0H18DRAFT_872669 [Fomitopsis serialis]|uniref:uncharacterized protein n=1 Tax=Fomitopsis serialis TaxID=139415 RepID=UPI0020072E03|nr:uncharacterized protein B0H18DRAFT_872669 [Neoantrodia serialis]KAH9930850.1 hypothetical protein B0H18DRAFT_872669 [Neoantrodia serialis]